MTVDKIQEYLELVTRHLLVDSVKECVEALKAGIDDVFPATALRCFCPDELQVRGHTPHPSSHLCPRRRPS